MPQVGASTQDSGPTHPGSRESDTSRPVTSQTGNSSKFESALAFRYSTKVEARTSPSRPSPSTAAGSATRNAIGWATSSGTSKKSQPQNSVAISE
jgi:hypothetical protein